MKINIKCSHNKILCAILPFQTEDKRSWRVTTHVDILHRPGNSNLCEITDQIDSSGCSWKKAEG